MSFIKKNLIVVILAIVAISGLTVTSSASWIWGELDDVTILMQSVVGNYPRCGSAILHTEGDFVHRSFSALGCDICPEDVVDWATDFSDYPGLAPDCSEAVKEFPWSCWSKHDMCSDWGITLN